MRKKLPCPIVIYGPAACKVDWEWPVWKGHSYPLPCEFERGWLEQDIVIESYDPTSIERSSHPYNWAGVCLRLCWYLRKHKFPLTLELLQACPPEWREAMAKAAVMGSLQS